MLWAHHDGVCMRCHDPMCMYTNKVVSHVGFQYGKVAGLDGLGAACATNEAIEYTCSLGSYSPGNLPEQAFYAR